MFSTLSRSYCGQRPNNPFRNAIPDQINPIDTEVVRADNSDVILELRNQRAILGRKINSFMPGVNLPPEVLTIIFEFACCSTEDDGFLGNTEKHFEENWDEDLDNRCAGTPLSIAQVCSVWRNIALGASQLWTNVTIFHEDRRDENQAQMFKYWLSKSGERPLNVLLMQQDSSDSEVTQCTAVIEVLVTYAHRLRTLDTFLPAKWESAMGNIANRVPLLTHLTLRLPKNDDDPSMEHIDIFANAPQLRKVTLPGYDIVAVSLPWAQLESVESPYSSVSQCVDTLYLCPRLRRFAIDLNGDRPPRTVQSMKHTTLEALEVSSYDEMLLPELFKVLELPALSSFRLWLSDYTFHWGLCQLPSFLSRITGTLESLYIPCAFIISEGFLATLRVVPKLRKLVLLNRYFVGTRMELTQEELDLLNPNKSNEAGTRERNESNDTHYLLPNLETFEFCGEIDFTPHALVEFLVARWQGPSALAESGQPERQKAGDLAPPKLDTLPTRLRSAMFKTPIQIQFEGVDADVIQKLRLEGMHLEFHEFPL